MVDAQQQLAAPGALTLLAQAMLWHNGGPAPWRLLREMTFHQQQATLLSRESVVQMRGHPERANTTEAQRGISSRELAP